MIEYREDTMERIWEVQKKMAEEMKGMTPEEKTDYYSEMASGVLKEIATAREKVGSQ